MKRLHTRTLVVALAATCSLAAASCGSDAKTSSTSANPATTATTAASTAASTAPTTAASTPPSVAPEATVASTPGSTADTPAAGVQLVDSTLGTILADPEGRTLYLFTKDTAGASACSGGCATAWPALAGPATPGTGLDAEDFGTITRDDGTVQATFYGHPLYTFAGDANPGDVTGQGTNDVWYVVGADGNAIEAAPTVPGY